MGKDIGNPTLFSALDEAGTLQAKINKFINFPEADKRVLSQKEIDDIHSQHNIFSGNNRKTIPPGMFNQSLRQSLQGYGIHAGRQPPSIPSPVPGRILAGLVFIRNLTSHRFPAPAQEEEKSWFDVWSNHLPAINRTILWGAFLLWKVTSHYRSATK